MSLWGTCNSRFSLSDYIVRCAAKVNLVCSDVGCVWTSLRVRSRDLGVLDALIGLVGGRCGLWAAECGVLDLFLPDVLDKVNKFVKLLLAVSQLVLLYLTTLESFLKLFFKNLDLLSAQIKKVV